MEVHFVLAIVLALNDWFAAREERVSSRYDDGMSQVWTRSRAGTAASGPLVRQPVSDRPQLHLIELPLEWAQGQVQVYLIEGQPLTLIDTGVRTEASLAALSAALDSLGYALRDIERIIVTHAHRDHFGAIAAIRAAGASLEVCVHEADADRLENFEAFVRARRERLLPLVSSYGVPEDHLRVFERENDELLALELSEGASTPVDRRLRDGDRIEWKDWGLRVLHAPGHTPGHIMLEDAEAGFLFTGDQVMGQAIPYAENFYDRGLPDPRDTLRRPSRFRGLIEMRRTLRQLRGRRDKILLPGYGGVITRADRAIRDTLLHYDVRLQRIDRGLRHLAAMGQAVTAFELWKALYPSDESLSDARSHLLLLIGALDCLEEDGHLVTERRADGTLTHHHR